MDSFYFQVKKDFTDKGYKINLETFVSSFQGWEIICKGYHKKYNVKKYSYEGIALLLDYVKYLYQDYVNFSSKKEIYG